MNMVYIASPYTGNMEKNVRNAKRYCQFAVRQGVIPLAPHLHFPQFMDDSKEKERELGMSFAINLLDRCDELWVFATAKDGITQGMKQEIAYAKTYKIPIKRYNTQCKEVELE